MAVMVHSVRPKRNVAPTPRLQIGAIWPHKNGEGFDLVIPSGLSVTGRIVCTKRKAPEQTV
jgi:hypothetical protein